MKIPSIAAILATTLIIGCGQRDEAKWEVVRQVGEQRGVIAEVEPGEKFLSAKVKGLILSQLEMGPSGKSSEVSFVRKSHPGSTETIGPLWIEVQGDDYVLMSVGRVEESEVVIGTPLSGGTKELSLIKRLMIDEFERLLKPITNDQRG